MLEVLVRVLGICLALAGTEMLHGIARVRLLVPRVGKERAQQVSIVTGSLLAFLVCRLLVPSLGLTERGPLLTLGLVLAAFMASFDVAVSRYLVKRPWSAVVDDFNPGKGNYLLFGLVLLTLFPTVVMAVAGRS